MLVFVMRMSGRDQAAQLLVVRVDFKNVASVLTEP